MGNWPMKFVIRISFIMIFQWYLIINYLLNRFQHLYRPIHVDIYWYLSLVSAHLTLWYLVMYGKFYNSPNGLSFSSSSVFIVVCSGTGLFNKYCQVWIFSTASIYLILIWTHLHSWIKLFHWEVGYIRLRLFKRRNFVLLPLVVLTFLIYKYVLRFHDM
jgi:hypothetical protein